MEVIKRGSTPVNRKGELKNVDVAWEVLCRGRKVDLCKIYNYRMGYGRWVVMCPFEEFQFYGKSIDEGFKGIEKMLLKANIQDYQNSFKSIEVIGVLFEVDCVYDYKSCPGKDSLKCGNEVAEGQTICTNPNCRRTLLLEDLKDSYFLQISVFSNNSGLFKVKSSSDILGHLETGAEDTADKFSHLIGSCIKIEIKINANINLARDAMLESITVIPWCKEQIFYS